jgi:uncharacterized membrane protein
MQNFLLPFFLTVPILVTLDLLWLGVLMKDFYRSQLGHLLSPSIGWGAAVAFYLIFTLGMYVFAIAPAADKGWQQALILGVLFGFFAYATYDLTNMATLKNWPLLITTVDILWGTVLGGMLGTAGYFLVIFFSK